MPPIVSAMRWPRRRSSGSALPDEVRSRLPLGRHERVLAASRLDDDTWVVASSVALLVVGGGRVVRHAWHEVAEATWEPETRLVAVRWANPGESPLLLRLGEEPGRVPEVVRERVMSTYVLSQRVPVRGRRGVTVAVRRDAGDGTLMVQAVPDEGIDPQRPETAEKVAAMARDLAEQVGLRS
jgi:hypothetical protein